MVAAISAAAIPRLTALWLLRASLMPEKGTSGERVHLRIETRLVSRFRSSSPNSDSGH
jgi:hypothetical protein